MKIVVHHFILFALTVNLIACNDRAIVDEAPLDIVAPELTIETPERGSTITGTEVFVSGHVSDDTSIQNVEIAGVKTSVNAEGNFEALITLDKTGVHIIETIAVDEAGNKAQDTRGVMAMPFLTSKDIIPDAIVAFLGPPAFVAISNLIKNYLEGDSVSDSIVAMEPIVVGGSCLGANLDFISLDYTAVASSLIAQNDGLLFNLSLDDLNVALDTTFQVACVSGTSDVIASATSARVNASLSLQLINGEVKAEIVGEPVIGFDQFSIDLGNIPSVVTNLFVGFIENRIVGFLSDEIQALVPELVEGVFADFSGGKEVNFIDQNVFVQVVPTELSIDADGLEIAADAATFLDDFVAPHDLMRPSYPTVIQSGSGVDMAISETFVNQLIATLWASGAMDFELPLLGEGRLAQAVDTISLSWLLPPQLTISDSISPIASLELRIGDAEATAYKAGAAVTRIAISSLVDIEAGVDVGLWNIDGTSRVTWLDVLDNAVAGANILNSNEVEMLASHSAHHAVRVLLDRVNGTPFPVFAGLRIDRAELEFGNEGYLNLRGDMSAESPVESADQ